MESLPDEKLRHGAGEEDEGKVGTGTLSEPNTKGRKEEMMDQGCCLIQVGWDAKELLKKERGRGDQLRGPGKCWRWAVQKQDMTRGGKQCLKAPTAMGGCSQKSRGEHE